MPEPCDEMEDLVSRAMDRELQPKDRTGLEAHLEKCADCRAAVRAFARLDLVLEKGTDLPAPPPCPEMPSARPFAAWKRRFALAAAAGLLVVAFFGGALWGERKMARLLPPPYGRVASAALWERAPEPARQQAALAALPLSEAVSGYQLEVARLLAEEQVDWARVRRLVEAIGDLRTDMELLTIHVAYIEREQGKRVPAGAAWSGLLGLENPEGSL